MRNLIVCCDGTWNTPDEQNNGVPTPTNVKRLYNAVLDAPDQLKYYHPGVGTDGTWWNKIAGGAVGEGLNKNIQSAYAWLGENYQADDRIFIFGFSRGAYTARSLGGLICCCGLLDLSHAGDEALEWDRVNAAFKQYATLPGKRAAGWAGNWPFHLDANGKAVPIHFMGVWDTVGALGVPEDLALLSLLDNIADIEFHDTALHPMVLNARHAVGLDEMRASFAPTLWSNVAARTDTVKQIWFPGVHSDVGGGYPETGLSNRPLQWMLQEAGGCGLKFNDKLTGQIKANPQDVLHNSCTGPWKALRTQPRNIPLLALGSIVDPSAIDRLTTPPIAQSPYRVSVRLGVGEAKTLPIYAAQLWNETGIYIEAGATYEFTAAGEWLDASIKCDPDGTEKGQFQPAEFGQMLGSLMGKLQSIDQKLTGNTQANLIGAKRAEDQNWFALLGVITDGGDPNADGTPGPLSILPLKKQFTLNNVNKPGYLYCFANDSWHFYDNNRGSVALTVKRTA